MSRSLNKYTSLVRFLVKLCRSRQLLLNEMDWQLFGEVDVVDMRNGFSLVKFTNFVDYNSL